MLQKTTILKRINLIIFLFFLVFASFTSFAQKVKIDGVAVVIGKNIVLNSDIDKFKQEIEKRSEGKIKISDCEMLEELMQQKLLSHHAVVDSVTVSDAEITANVDRNIAYFTQEFGSVDKVIKAYGFNSIEDLKNEIYTVEKDNLLIQREQAKITEKVDVTPEEVRLYFNGLKDKGELPEIPAEVEIAQIVFKAIEYREFVPEFAGMFQKEVALRIAEKEGSKIYGILSVLTQAFFDVEYLFTVPPTVFNPPPKVDSGVIRLIRKENFSLPVDEKLFFKVVKTAFNQRRKMLRSSLKSFNISDSLKEDPIFAKRPEQLSVQEFIFLTQKLANHDI